MSLVSTLAPGARFPAADTFFGLTGTYCIKYFEIYFNSPSCSGGGTAGETGVTGFKVQVVFSIRRCSVWDTTDGRRDGPGQALSSPEELNSMMVI